MSYIWLVGLVYFGMHDQTVYAILWTAYMWMNMYAGWCFVQLQPHALKLYVTMHYTEEVLMHLDEARIAPNGLAAE